MFYAKSLMIRYTFEHNVKLRTTFNFFMMFDRLIKTRQI